MTEQCILYSALDADVRHFEVVIPRRGGGDLRRSREAALKMMERNMSADPCRAEEVDFGRSTRMDP